MTALDEKEIRVPAAHLLDQLVECEGSVAPFDKDDPAETVVGRLFKRRTILRRHRSLHGHVVDLHRFVHLTDGLITVQ